MSLLLDALKKAADEKKKDSSAARLEEEAKVSAEVSDEIDMDLELAQDKEDEFPEVHEEIKRPVVQEPENKIEAVIEDESKQEVEPVLELEVEHIEPVVSEAESEPESNKDVANEVSTVKDVEINAVDSDAIKEDVTEDTALNENIPDASQPEKTAVTQPQQRAQVAANELKRNRDMEALSALINKNNEYRDKNRRLISMSIIVSILLVLLGASLYAYIMLDDVETSRKNLAVDDVASQPTNEQRVPDVVKLNNKDKSGAQAPVVKQPVISNKSATVKAKVVKPASKKPIQIKRKSQEDPIGVLLAQAYAAFKQSEYVTSEKLYNKVINRDKNNHDALLGLAALAVKQGHNEDARRIYSQLLKLDPKDSYAKAGLSALVNQRNVQLDESQIKIMLREQPNASHLHFALGNIMLSQKRYAEAQTEFFNAWSASKSNTDYAYNLAISLDHLGKPQHAAEFYELTLKLYEVSGGNVSVDNIKQRIEQIRGGKNG